MHVLSHLQNISLMECQLTDRLTGIQKSRLPRFTPEWHVMMLGAVGLCQNKNKSNFIGSYCKYIFSVCLEHFLNGVPVNSQTG